MLIATNESCPDCGEWIIGVIDERGHFKGSHTCGENTMRWTGILKTYGTDGTINIEGEFG